MTSSQPSADVVSRWIEPAGETSTSPTCSRAPSTTSEPRATYMTTVPAGLCARIRPPGKMRASCRRRPFSSWRSSTEEAGAYVAPFAFVGAEFFLTLEELL